MSEYLSPVVIRVKADVDSALVKIRALRDELKTLKDTTAKIKIKEEFSQSKAAIAAAAAEARKLDSELKNSNRDTGFLGRSFKTLFSDIRKGVKEADGGFFSKLFGAGKGIFKNIERGAKDAWKGLKDLGSAFSDVWGVMTRTADEGLTLQKSFNNVGTAVAGVVAGLAEMGPGLILVVAAIVAAIIPIGALISGLLAAAGALTAGAIGVGALLAVGIPAVKNMISGLQQLSQATNAYSQASKNLNIGLRTSKQDMQQYQSVLKGVDPNLRGAVKLLRDQHVQWQNLTPAQRRSVVALSENNAALKAMSPAMKAALTALLQQKAAYDRLTPAQRQFAKSLSSLQSEWRQVQKAAQPVITLLLNDLVKLAKDALPLVTPMINATGKAIDGLLKRADNFVKSEQFKAWVKKLTAEIPKVITQVGNFISKLAGLIGPIITNKKNLQDLHNTLTTVYNILHGVIDFLNQCSTAFNGLMHAASPIIGILSAISGALNAVENAATAAANAIGNLVGLGGIGSGIAAGIHALGYASGGVTGPGWRVVGERGPEMEWSPGGDVILPNHHPVTQGAIRGYANGTGAMLDSRPINVYVDGQKLFTIMKNRTLGYNVANNKRTPGGSATGVMAV